jgi:hypothetical protein
LGNPHGAPCRRVELELELPVRCRLRFFGDCLLALALVLGLPEELASSLRRA